MISDGLDMCRSYLSAHRSHAPNAPVVERHLASVTIARQAGTGGAVLARMLADRLNLGAAPDAVPWTVFDQDLMQRVLRDHHLPEEIARFFPEAHWSEIDGTINTLLHRHPDPWEVWGQAEETIRRLAQLGHAIFVGRGINFTTAGFDGVFHVRLIGSPQPRLQRLRERFHWNPAEARTAMERSDRDRRSFVRQHFDREIEDPLAYSLVLNTDQLTHEEIVDLLTRWVGGWEHPTVA